MTQPYKILVYRSVLAVFLLANTLMIFRLIEPVIWLVIVLACPVRTWS